MTTPKIFTMSFASVYPLYVAKAERKGRTKDEVDTIIRWLFGYSQQELERHLEQGTDFQSFIAKCAHPNPSRSLIKGWSAASAWKRSKILSCVRSATWTSS